MDKAKKKRLKKYTTWICMVLVVALLAAMPLLARKEAEEKGPVASILEGTVQMQDLEVGLQGGGTLAADSTMDVELPKGVKITEFLVSNGDTVSKGDPVAVVDKVSVMTAVLQVRETLDYIRDEMADVKDETAAATVKATAGGRVKQVFARAGDEVRDVMLRHGALAVLSLDGMMAVDLEAKTDLAGGDSVRVTMADGTEVSGRVESNLEGVLVVTVDDQNYEVGQTVSVSSENGRPIGSGSLYVHNAWRATAIAGTVRSVSARENTDVYSGSTLFTLKDTDFAGTLEGLAAMHREYEEVLQKLFAMHESGVITAPCDGQVSGVDRDSAFLLAAIQGEAGWFVDLLDNSTEERSWTVMLLSSVTPTCTGTEGCEAEEHDIGCPMKCTGKDGCKELEGKKHSSSCAVYCTGLPNCMNQNHKAGCLSICTGSGDTCKSELAAGHHMKSCIRRCVSDTDENASPECDADVHTDICLENCTGTETCEALTHKSGCYKYGIVYKAYAFKITQKATDKTQVLWGTTLYDVMPGKDGWTLANPDKIKDKFPGVNGVDYDGPELPKDCGEGDILLLVMEVNGAGEVIGTKAYVYEAAQKDPQTPGGFPNGMGGFGGMSGMKGFGGKGAMGGTTAEEDALYDLEADILMTVTAREKMTLTVTLDEKDIAKVTMGQQAVVKVNPLKGRTFAAEVTDIGNSGTNNGGSSKFTVELTLDMDADMIPGMSATAWLPLYTKKDVLTVPVAALVEQEGKTLVYTALDPESGEPTRPVEVTTGLSDGEMVEILSGLTQGQTYYYSYYDTLELSTEVEQKGFSFG